MKVKIQVIGPPGSGKTIVFASLLEWLQEHNAPVGAAIEVDLDESVKADLVFLDQVEIQVEISTIQCLEA